MHHQPIIPQTQDIEPQYCQHQLLHNNTRFIHFRECILIFIFQKKNNEKTHTHRHTIFSTNRKRCILVSAFSTTALQLSSITLLFGTLFRCSHKQIRSCSCRHIQNLVFLITNAMNRKIRRVNTPKHKRILILVYVCLCAIIDYRSNCEKKTKERK